MPTKNLESILRNYFPNTELLEKPASSPVATVAWKEELEDRSTWSGDVIKDLADEYVSQGMMFRNPILESQDEGSGMWFIADGVSRVAALKLLVDRGDIELRQANVEVSPYAPEPETNDSLFFGKSAGLDKNVFTTLRGSQESLFTVSISASSPDDGISPVDAIFGANDNGFFDKASTFKINDYAWANALTGSFDSKENTGDLLFQVDFNAEQCDDEFLMTTYADLERKLEGFSSSIFDDFGVTVNIDFMEAEKSWKLS